MVQLRRILAVLITTLLLMFCLSGLAEARTRHHHWTHHHHWVHRHHHRHRHHWHHHRWSRISPSRYRATYYPPGQSDLLAVAERYMGDRNPTGFRGPWCKAFVNMVARRTGHLYNVSKRAIDGLRMGIRVRMPRPGDLAVMRHHITFFAGWGGRGFIGVGGNQGGGRVTMSTYPVGRVIGWIRLE